MEIKEKLTTAAKVFFLMGDRDTANEILDFIEKLNKVQDDKKDVSTDQQINVVFEVAHENKNNTQ